MNPISRPNDDQLRRFLLGELGQDESAAVVAWVESDPAAPEVLRGLHVDDTITHALGDTSSSVVSDPDIDRVIQRAIHPTEPDQTMAVEIQPERLGGYRIVRVLGRGGMGVVYEAVDETLQRKVALKVLAGTGTLSNDARARFLREARAAAAIEHPHIIAIYQVGQDRGIPYLAMPLLKGETLEDLLARTGKLPLDEAIRIACEMAEGLAAAHAQGLIHRDVKPGNIWLESQPSRGVSQVKLLDFGLARSQGDDTNLTQSGTIVGTPAFMAPEQARGDKVDGRVDLFSLGCVLYVMLTGERPFQGSSTMALLASLALDTPPMPHTINPNVPPALSAFVMRLLAKQPDQRPGTALEVLNELRQLAHPAAPAMAFPATPAPAEVPAIKPAPVRSRQRVLVAAGLLLVALGVGAILFGTTIVRIATNQGELIVEVDDPDIEVSIKQGGATVADRKKDRTFVLTARGGEVEFYDPVTGVRLLTKEFTLERGGKVVVRASDHLAAARKPVDVKPVGPITATTKDREKPFVLVRQGKEAGEYKTFPGVWAEYKHGDEITIHGNGPFPLPHVQVQDRMLVLKGAPGFRPVFVPHESLFEKRGQPWFELQNAGLEIEGCEFHMRGTPFYQNGAHPPPLVVSGGLPCYLRRCTLLGFSQLFLDFKSPSLTLEDSFVICLGGPLLGPSVGCQVRLTNNLLFNPGVLVDSVAPKGTEIKIHLMRNTLVGYHQISRGFFVQQNASMTVVAEGNLIDLSGGKSWPVAKVAHAGVRWQGKGNAYAGLYEGLAGWNALLAQPEIDSREIPAAPFGWRLDIPGEMARAVPWWQERLMQTRRETGLHDLGPDLSLLGAGDAWLRGLSVEGKAVPKEVLRPEPLPTGKIVLMRQGKDVRGFAKLSEAFDAAQDGDVIELRTDGELTGSYVPRDRGSVTLRAGLGYRPVIVSFLHFQSGGTAVALEGLTFSTRSNLAAVGPSFSFEQAGRISRMAYCTFETREDSEQDGLRLDCLFSPGTTTEIVRCFIPRPLQLHIPPDATVRFRECVLGPISYKTIDDKANIGTLELEACILSQPRARSECRLFAALDQQPTLRCVTRRCLFESPTSLIDASYRIESWRGTRNCFRLGGWWVTSGSTATGLLQWRAYSKNAEEGSVESDPLINDVNRWRLRGDNPVRDVGADIERIAFSVVPAPLKPDRGP